MKKIITLFIAAILVIGLCACGGDSEYAGKYECVDVYWAEMDFDIGPDGEWIELDSNGKGDYYMGDTLEFTADIKWSVDGDVFKLGYDDVTTYEGTLKDGVLEIDMEDITYTFVIEGGAVPEPQTDETGEANAAEPAIAAEPAEDNSSEASADETISDSQQTEYQSYWNGDWYGWWIIDDGYGEYSEMADGTYWYDCCAYIDIDEDGIGSIDIWDELCSSDELLACVNISVGYGTTDAGCMMSESGSFWDAEVKNADWIVDPGASDVSDYDHMICIDGVFVDPSNEDNYFYYYIYMRPWGMVWDDVGDYYMPYYYYDWYLPCIESGAEMPDTIGDGNYETSDDDSGSGDISIGIHGDGEAPDSAPAGGDGITALDFDGLKAKADALYADYSYDEMKQLAYEDIVAFMDGVEGEYEDDGLENRWSYNWHGTDGTHWNVKFDAETGLFYTSTLYEF